MTPFDIVDVLVEEGAEELADVDEVAEVLAAAQAADQVLSAAEDGLNLGRRFVGHLEDAGGGVDEAAVGGVALDDLGVELDAEAGGQAADDIGEVGLAADLFEAFAAGELVGDGDLVDRLVAVPEVDAGLVDPSVLLAEEVEGLEDRGDLEDRLWINQEGGDDGLFGLGVVRRQPFEEGTGHGWGGAEFVSAAVTPRSGPVPPFPRYSALSSASSSSSSSSSSGEASASAF